MKARKKDESLGQLAFDWLQAAVILPVVQAVTEFIKKLLLGFLWIHIQLPAEEQYCYPEVLKVPEPSCC